MSDEREALRKRWLAKGWPEELLERTLAAGLRIAVMEWWLDDRTPVGLEHAEQMVRSRERLTFGTIRGREATLADNDAFADLWANSPEQIGEWEVVVERSPNAFAQYQLQENVSIPVLEERGVILACVVWSQCNTVVAGKRLSVHCGQGLRVRKDCRGEGYGNLVRAVRRPATRRPTMGQFHYIRAQNYAAVDFFRHTSPHLLDSSQEGTGDVPGIPVSVLQYPARAMEGGSAGIRPARRSDVRRCVALTNRTHNGMDLFKPYTAEWLALRLDEEFWGIRPVLWPYVYGWADFHVVEEKGRVVACGGLWDRGRDIHERWRHPSTGQERAVSSTALMDWGFEPGCEEAMGRLIAYFVGETSCLERDYLIAPIDHMPALVSRLDHLQPARETRGLGWLLWDEYDRAVDVAETPITRPYTDLAYW